MILRGVYLMLEDFDFPDELSNTFGFRTSSLTHFLERTIKPVKFCTSNYGRVVVVGSSHPNPNCTVEGENALCVEVPFDENAYLALRDKEELSEHFIAMLTKGFRKAHKQYPLPLDELLAGMEEFRAGGYVNKWTQKVRQFREFGIKCRLECELTIEAFHARLVVLKGKEAIFDKEILTTLPDEICFYHKVRDIVVKNNRVAVVGSSRKRIFSMDLGEIL
jgi:hypothetical protein